MVYVYVELLKDRRGRGGGRGGGRVLQEDGMVGKAGEGGLGTPLDVFVVSRPLRGFVYVVQPVVYVARVLER